MATNPKSEGVSSLAKTMLTKNIENLVPNLEVSVHKKPENVFLANDNWLVSHKKQTITL
jgi:hypothetical protein